MEWKDITLNKFKEIQSILEGEEDDLTKKVYLYASLTGEQIEVVRDIPLGIFLKAYSKECVFLEQKMPQYIPEFWEFNGVKYKITTQINELSAGQYIDLKEYGKVQSDIHKVMAVLCYDGEAYDGKTHEERSKLFNEFMPITIAAPLSAFFLELWKQWSEILLAYSVKVLRESEAEWSNTDGSTGSILSVVKD